MLSTNKLTFPTEQLVLDFPSQEAGSIEHGCRGGHKERPSIALTSFSGRSRQVVWPGQKRYRAAQCKEKGVGKQKKEKGKKKEHSLVQAAQ